MTDVIGQNFGSVPIEHNVQERQTGGGLAKRMQRLLAWEKAYLEEQQTSVNQENSKSKIKQKAANQEVKENSRPVLAETAVVGDILTLTRQIPDKQSATAGAGINVNADSATKGGQQRARSSSMPGINFKPLSSVSNPLKQQKPKCATPKFDLTTTPEKQNVRVVQQNGEIKVWMRDGQFNGCSGLLLVSQLREVFSTTGLKLAAVTLNGEKLWSNEGGSVQDKSDPKTDNEINKVY